MALQLTMLVAWLTLVCRAAAAPVRRAVLLEDISQLRPVYDYVVIGGGTSGLVVANRLTEDPESKSLFIVRNSMVGGY